MVLTSFIILATLPWLLDSLQIIGTSWGMHPPHMRWNFKKESRGRLSNKFVRFSMESPLVAETKVRLVQAGFHPTQIEPEIQPNQILTGFHIYATCLLMLSQSSQTLIFRYVNKFQDVTQFSLGFDSYGRPNTTRDYSRSSKLSPTPNYKQPDLLVGLINLYISYHRFPQTGTFTLCGCDYCKKICYNQIFLFIWFSC